MAKGDRRRRKTKPKSKNPAGQAARRYRKALQQEGIEMGLSLADRMTVDSLVTPQAQLHGVYRPIDFKLQEVVEGGKLKAKTAKVVRNLARTQIDRWSMRGKLDDRQLAAVMFYQAAWGAWIGEPRVTANYSPAITRNAKGAIELWASSRLRAKEGLRLLDQEVFFREPVDHFQVWQNVVIWDEPAGVAGGRIGFCHKPAEAVAQLIVGGLAHKIADIVIDRSRSEFGDLLLDLDAPRRPGRRAA